MDFVDPIYIDIQRHGTFDEEKITYLKWKFHNKLVETKKDNLKKLIFWPWKMNDVENSIYLNFNTIEIIYFYDFFKKWGKITFINSCFKL